MQFFEWEYAYTDNAGDAFNADPLSIGPSNGDPLPMMGTGGQSPDDGPYSTVRNIIGSIPQTARDVGTVVGTLERDLRAAKGEYQTARSDAKAGDKLRQWWNYAPTTDKVMVGIGIAGLALVIYQTFKGK